MRKLVFRECPAWGFAAFAIGLLVWGAAMAAPPDFASPGTQIVDARGMVVGNLVPPPGVSQGNVVTTVIRQINGFWFYVIGNIQPTGLEGGFGAVVLYYTSANCSGTAYMDAVRYRYLEC